MKYDFRWLENKINWIRKVSIKGEAMKTKVGLWIDHREAIIVTIADKKEEIKQITSEVEKQPRRSGDSPLKGCYDHLQVPADNKKLKAFTEHIKNYYNEVIACIRCAESILIFGPGEAKHELKRQLENDKLDGHVVGIETVDKMTEHQVVEKVRKYFLK